MFPLTGLRQKFIKPGEIMFSNFSDLVLPFLFLYIPPLNTPFESRFFLSQLCDYLFR